MAQLVPWLVFCLLVLALALTLPRTARVFLGVFFVLMAVGVNWTLSLVAPDLFVRLGTDAPLLAPYAWLFENVIALAPPHAVEGAGGAAGAARRRAVPAGHHPARRLDPAEPGPRGRPGRARSEAVADHCVAGREGPPAPDPALFTPRAQSGRAMTDIDRGSSRGVEPDAGFWNAGPPLNERQAVDRALSPFAGHRHPVSDVWNRSRGRASIDLEIATAVGTDASETEHQAIANGVDRRMGKRGPGEVAAAPPRE
jgi:hypothetical protein